MDEVTEASAYYEASSPRLGSTFLEEIRRSMEQVEANPEASQMIGRRVRRKPLKRFPYNLIYAAYQDRIRIVAVAHHKRRPYYWIKRIKNNV